MIFTYKVSYKRKVKNIYIKIKGCIIRACSLRTLQLICVKYLSMLEVEFKPNSDIMLESEF